MSTQSTPPSTAPSSGAALTRHVAQPAVNTAIGAALSPETLGMLTTVEAIAAQMGALAKVANVISPFTRPSHLAPGFVVTVAVVQIDPTVDDRTGNGAEVYRASFMKADQRAFNRIALRRISAALGIDWLPFPHCRRVDDNSKTNYAEFTVEGVYRTFDGSVQKVRGTSACDFRDGSEQIGGWTPKLWADLVASNRAALGKKARKEDLDWNINGWSEQRVRQARAKVLERAETLAQNRAIRDIGIKHVYTLEELRRPFVCFRMTFVPDTTDPEIKRLVTLNALAGLSMLYPQAGPLLPAPAASSSHGSGDVIDVPASSSSSSAPAAAATTPAAPTMDTIAVPAVEAEPAQVARTIVEAGKSSDGLGFCVILDGGDFFRVDEGICRAAIDMKRDGRRVFVTSEKRPRVDAVGQPVQMIPKGGTALRTIEDLWILEMAIAPASAPQPGDAAVPADAEFVAEVEAFESPAGTARPWTRYQVTTQSGLVWSTFDKAIADIAVEARDARPPLPVRATTEPSTKYPGRWDLKGLRILDGSEPDLPFADGPDDEQY